MSITPSQNVAGILPPPSQPAREKAPRLRPKLQAFVRHYLETGNGTKSAILAGYSKKSAAAAASRLLTIPEIKAAIDGELLHRAEMSGISATYVLEGIRAIAEDTEVTAEPPHHGALDASGDGEVARAGDRARAQPRRLAFEPDGQRRTRQSIAWPIAAYCA